MPHRPPFRALCVLTCGLLLAGCGRVAPIHKVGDVRGASGGVHGGQNPVSGAAIQLWRINTASDGGPGTPMLTTTVTSSDGSGNATDPNANAGNLFNTLPAGYFTITGDYVCPAGDALVFITASGGNPGLSAGTNNPQAKMVTALGSCNNLQTNVRFININEQTTVATVASLHAFMSAYNAIGASPAHLADIAASFALMNEYADFQSAIAPGPALPAGYSASTGDLNLLANVLASCVNSAGGSYNDGSPCGTLFVAGSSPYATSASASTDVTAAALFIHNYYSTSPGQVASLASSQAPFQPADTTPPPDWTLPIFELPPAPTFSLVSGTYSGVQRVVISDVDPSVAIYYTTGANPPTVYSQSYLGAITVDRNETITAFASSAKGRGTSAIASASYAITGIPTNAPTVAATTPAFAVATSTALTLQAASNANGSIVTFSTSSSVGGSFSAPTCTIASGYCNVMYTPSSTLPPGTYANGLTANFSAADGYAAASLNETVYVTPADMLVPLSTSDGAQSSLIEASDGNFYGLDQQEGSAFVGRVFKMDHSGNMTTIYSFTGGSDGAYPEDHLVQGTDGDLYGVTLRTNSGGNGTLYKVDRSGNFTLLYSFTGSVDGARPTSSLVQGTDGAFYGTAELDGANGYGTLFKISSAGDFTLLHGFAGGSEGAFPQGSLLQGGDGNFYGTTGRGGSYDQGTLYKMDSSGDVTTLYSFTGGADGTASRSGLTQATDGNFYGLTTASGAFGGGTIFRLDSANHFTTLHSFAGPDGSYPEGALVQASDGDLYGTALLNGFLYGSLYKIDTAGNFTLLYDFSGGNDGDGPGSSLLQASDGSFYGATSTSFFTLNLSPSLAGPVTLTVPSSVSHGTSFALSFAVTNASSATMRQCVATNTAGDASEWTGIKTASTTATNVTLTTPSAAGTYTYALTCGGVESGFATLNVN